MNSKTLLAVAALTFAVSAAPANDAKTDMHALRNAKLSLTEAIGIAEKKGNGKATDADIQATSGGAQYAVEVLSADGKKLTEYKLDADTGHIEAANNEPLEKLFTRVTPLDLASAQVSLTSAIRTAERQTGGKVIDVETDRRGQDVRYDLTVAKDDGTTENVKINGSTGRLASAK